MRHFRSCTEKENLKWRKMSSVYSINKPLECLFYSSLRVRYLWRNSQINTFKFFLYTDNNVNLSTHNGQNHDILDILVLILIVQDFTKIG